MDIYRARFVQYPIAGINALAFSHASQSDFTIAKGDGGDRSSLKLAVGRSNGDIEIWNPLGGRWVQETIFHGGKGRSVEGLLWTQEQDEQDEDDRLRAGALRLFSIGYSNAVTEWNLLTGLPLREWSGNESEIWCIAAQPRFHVKENKNSRAVASDAQWLGQNIVAGCADGSLVVLTTADNDLQFQRFLARPTTKSARVLSLHFQNRSTVVAGYADSTVKLFDMRKGQLIRSISLGAGPKGGPKNILVWSVRTMPNGDIVTGDSTGEVRFFERKQLTQIHRIASHDADILDLAVSQKGGIVFSTGMDRRTARYSREGDKWSKSEHTTLHEHDVRALVAHEGGALDVLASGGVDTNLVISPLSNFGEQYQYTISGLPQWPSICASIKARLIVCWWEREVSIWSVSKDPNPAQKKHSLRARIAVRGDENITSAAISPDGTTLVAATSAEMKAFQLQAQGQTSRVLSVKKLNNFGTGGARHVSFSPDGKWLSCITTMNDCKMLKIDVESQSISRTQTLRIPQRGSKQHAALGAYIHTKSRLAFSSDSKMLAVSDLQGQVQSWILHTPIDTSTINGQMHESDSESSSSDREVEDGTLEIWRYNKITHPKLDSPAIVLTFRPVAESFGQYGLLVLSAKHKLRELDMKTGYFTEWSKRNPASVLPEAFQKVKDRAMGSFYGANGWLWLYGSSWIFGLNIETDHSKADSEQTHSSHDEGHRAKKRKRDNTGAGDAVKRSDKSGLSLRHDSQSQLNGSLEHASDLDGSDSEDEMISEGLKGGHETQEDGTKGKAQWYLTHKYRPILGIVPVREASDENLPEVVLVERPIWTLDLPDRYDNEYS